MRLYFVRHGESEANILREISNRGLKHGLTDKGRQQSLSLAQNLKETNISRVFSSPLLRAIQTAEILARERGIKYEITDALREYDCGVLEGKSNAASWDIFTAVFNNWLQNGNWENRIEQGESFLEIRERFVPFIEHLVAEHGYLQEGIVLVGHGGTYRCMLPLVLVNIDFQFVLTHGFDNTGYAVAEVRPEGLVCLTWCGMEVAHG